jgi:hypothetical protein
MSQSYPSVQSFYKREVQVDKVSALEIPTRGDGFTEEELADALDPLNRKWNPERDYQEFTIASLVTGPKAVTFIGRIVNFTTLFGHSPKQPRAAGWHYMLVKDDSAAISVPTPFSLSLLLLMYSYCTN